MRSTPSRGLSIAQLFQQEDLNFLVTNRIPRTLATRFMGWFSKIENPVVHRLQMAAWRRFAPDLDLSDAKKDRFTSLHDCFTRELKPGSRAICSDPSIIVSPCDAVVGSFGDVVGTELIQAKGFSYTLEDLLIDPDEVERHRDGKFVTLRLRSTMYHRFHAPYDGRVDEVTYISGDTWNVNPIALRRVEKLFCKNERMVIRLHVPNPEVGLTLVPVAAILVASLRLRFLDETLNLQYRGPNRIPCAASLRKGDEMGTFEHGSTIIAFASGPMKFVDSLREGETIRMGQPLLRILP